MMRGLQSELQAGVQECKARSRSAEACAPQALDSEHSSFAERKGCMAWLQPKLLIPFCQQ
jgi:hypothetical protein